MEDIKKANKTKAVKKVNSGKTMTGVPKDEVVIRPKDKDPLKEARQKTAVFSFGRMNPPTIGHEALTKKLVQVARQQRAVPLIYLSHSQDSKKNPLSYDDKLKLAQAAFGQRLVVKSRARTIIQILKELQRQYTDIVLVVGSDRVSEFDKLLQTYNGRDYKFDSIKVVSAGTRDPDDSGVRGMSASKMRDAAAKKDIRTFERGLPPQLKSMADPIMGMIRAGLKLQEDLDREGLGPIDEHELTEARKPLTLLQRRRRAIIMRRYKNKMKIARMRVSRRMADKGRLHVRSRRAARRILRQRLAGAKGRSYSSLSPSEKMMIDKRVGQRAAILGRLSTRLMPRVKRAEMERLKRLRRNKSKKSAVHKSSRRKIRGTSEQFNIKFENFLAENYNFNVAMNDISHFEGMVDKFLDHIISETTSLTEKAEKNLNDKAKNNNLDVVDLKLVYQEGYQNPTGQQSPEQTGFMRVNQFIKENTKQTDKRQEREKKNLDIRHARQDAAAKVKEIRKNVNEKFEQLDELYYRVEVEGLPTFYIQQNSPSVIKAGLRKLLKKPDMIKDIEKVSPAEVRKAYQLRARGNISQSRPDPDPQKNINEVFEKLNEVGPAWEKRPKTGWTGDKVVKGKKGYDEYMAQAKKRKLQSKIKEAFGDNVLFPRSLEPSVTPMDSKVTMHIKKGPLEIGTDKIAKTYRADTPGQTVDPDPKVIDGTPGKDGKIAKPEFLKLK